MLDARAKISLIWHESYWKSEAGRIIDNYDKLLEEVLPFSPCPSNLEKVDHRIENFIRYNARVESRGRTYVGLSSSDLEDNIRIKRLEECYEILHRELCVFWLGLQDFATKRKDRMIQARTHLLPAGQVTIDQSFAVDYFSFLRIKEPKFVYKGIGGSLGTHHIQKYLGIDYIDLDKKVLGPVKVQQTSTQTVDHMTELDFAVWLSANAGLLARVANNIRQLFASGDLTYREPGLASSAIVDKKVPNPWRWERISGMAEQIYDLPGRICRVMSNCLLQRTLTNQSVLNHTFADATKVMAEMIIDTKDFERFHFTGKPVITMRGEEKVADLMMKGMDRFTAYNKINKK